MAEAIEQLVASTFASLQASDVGHLDTASRQTKSTQPPAKGSAGKRKENSTS
jgi:hypothetical protein